MLFFNLRIGDRLMIGKDVMLELVTVQQGYKARLGFEAPKDVAIHRLEIQDRIDQQRREVEDAGRDQATPVGK